MVLIQKMVFEFLAEKLLKNEALEMLSSRREKKEFCVPTHLTEAEALHVADQAGEREWSNSKYIRHLIIKDMQRQATDDHLMSGCMTSYTKQFEHSVRNEKSPVVGATELNDHKS